MMAIILCQGIYTNTFKVFRFDLTSKVYMCNKYYLIKTKPSIQTVTGTTEDVSQKSSHGKVYSSSVHCLVRKFKLNMTLSIFSCANFIKTVFLYGATVVNYTPCRRILNTKSSFQSYLTYCNNFLNSGVVFKHNLYVPMYAYCDKFFRQKHYFKNILYAQTRHFCQKKNCNSLFYPGNISMHHLNVPSFHLYVRNFSSKAGKVVIDKKMASWEMLVNVEKLTSLEQKIHERHRNAVKV